MGDMVQCRLCKRLFPITEMSEEHYPARCVGNTDIVGVDIIKLVDQLQSTEMRDYIMVELHWTGCLIISRRNPLVLQIG